MNVIGVICCVALVIFLIFIVLGVRRKNRRMSCLVMRLDEQQRGELAKDFPIFARLPEALRNELELSLIHI